MIPFLFLAYVFWRCHLLARTAGLWVSGFSLALSAFILFVLVNGFSGRIPASLMVLEVFGLGAGVYGLIQIVVLTRPSARKLFTRPGG
jgi:hypothetical protein